jgi:flagellar protein FlaJ
VVQGEEVKSLIESAEFWFLLVLALMFAFMAILVSILETSRRRRKERGAGKPRKLPPEKLERKGKPSRITVRDFGPARVEVKPAKEPVSISFVSKSKTLRRIAARLAADFRKDIPETGRTFSPYRFAARNLFAILISIFVIIPASIILTIFVSPFAILLLSAVPLLFVIPWVRIRMWVGDRKRALEEELPFFTIHATILQSAGQDLFRAFLSTIGKGVFRQIEQDAAVLQRNTSYFRMGPLEGLEELGRTNPNPKMRTLVLGYTSEWRSGGDTARYLETKTSDFLKDTEDRWKSYVGQVSIYGELTISFLFLLPILMLMAIFLSPNVGITIGLAFLALGIPMLATVGIALVRSSQPKIYDVIHVNPLASIFFGIAAGAIAFALTQSLILLIAAFLATACACIGIATTLQKREIKAHESALPQFLRDMTEYQKMGYDLAKGAIKASEENDYNPKFNALLRNVAHQLSMGIRFSELRIPTRSWLTRVAFFHLGEIAESGGYASKSLEMLNDFIGTVLRVKRNTQSSMRLYKGLSLVAPFALSVILGMLLGVFGSIAGMLSPASPLSGGVSMPAMSIVEVPPLLVPLCQLIIIASAFGIALVTSYASEFTLKSTLWIALCIILAGVGMVVADYLSGMVSTFVKMQSIPGVGLG